MAIDCTPDEVTMEIASIAAAAGGDESATGRVSFQSAFGNPAVKDAFVQVSDPSLTKTVLTEIAALLPKS